MRLKHMKTVRTAGGLLAGGVATGLLLAMTVPTTMKAQAGEGWRDLIREPTAAYEGSVQFAAHPEDLTPVYWQPASSEYGMPGADPWVGALPVQDLGDDYAPASEPLPAELLETQDGGASVELVQVDAAANSADAAQAAAEDVRAVESAAAQPTAPAPPIAEPQAVVAAS